MTPASRVRAAAAALAVVPALLRAEARRRMAERLPAASRRVPTVAMASGPWAAEMWALRVRVERAPRAENRVARKRARPAQAEEVDLTPAVTVLAETRCLAALGH